MLRRLSIRDFVLVDRLELEFGEGFSVLTGETGAGKSILIDALAFALGDRADTALIRAGCERAEVSAEFDAPDAPELLDWLSRHDLDAADGFLLRRVVDAGGRSRAYLNGSPVTLQQLKEATEVLIDIHGQHAHQSLLREDVQRGILDSWGALEPLAAEVASAWREWSAAAEKLKSARENSEAQAREREETEWQLKELEALGFSPDDWSELGVEHTRLAHAAGLLEGAQFVVSLLSEDDLSCGKQIDAALRRLDGLVEFDPALSEISALLHSVSAELSESVSALRRYAERVDIDPRRLEEVESRIEAILACARKFRTKPENLPELLRQCQEKMLAFREASDTVALEAREKTLRLRFDASAHALSAKRAEAAERLGTEISRIMQDLALGGGRFEAALSPLKIGGAQGFEKVEFRIAGLSGDATRPLAKVASGGELSRISLAIQVVASQAARVPTLVFDEVDAGIGGGVAEIVGRLLRRLGEERQILCVTHLPQVAARANWQWQVVKTGEGDGIRSRVELLDPKDRVEEIARMLGGIEITPITRKHAKEMLTQQETGNRKQETDQ
ncbi:MAG: DNA repair protein RecN [Candidatus Accumulibacter sp.]|jgi:DNA repair protein RecN (Recombination protein N)|nr:DNA repair protein RecN [Accumulibacter sp.]